MVGVGTGCLASDLGWEVDSQFPKGCLPGRARCQRKGQEGAVWAGILDWVVLRSWSEGVWGREGKRSGPMKLGDTDLQLGRAGEDAACTALETQRWRAAKPHPT